jgi:hypothetical protein
MIDIILSDFVLNSASFSFWQSGRNFGEFLFNQIFLGEFDETITDADIPSGSPYRLNTSSWSGTNRNFLEYFS